MNKISKELIKIAREVKALDEEGDGSGFQSLHQMNNNAKIKGVIDCQGQYENFTGVVNFEDIVLQVKNANVYINTEIRDYKLCDVGVFDGEITKGNINAVSLSKGVIFKNCKINFGSYRKCTFEKCTLGIQGSQLIKQENPLFCDCDIFDCEIYNGKIKRSNFFGGTFYNGVWVSEGYGRFNSEWKKGYDKNGKIHYDEPNKWKKVP